MIITEVLCLLTQHPSFMTGTPSLMVVLASLMTFLPSLTLEGVVLALLGGTFSSNRTFNSLGRGMLHLSLFQYYGR